MTPHTARTAYGPYRVHRSTGAALKHWTTIPSFRPRPRGRGRTEQETTMNAIIVSRHPAAIEFIRSERPELADAPVLASATADDVRGRIVYGNIPLHLACYARAVVAVEFAGDAPRCTEYDIEAMRAAGARLRTYTVIGGPLEAITSSDGGMALGGIPESMSPLPPAGRVSPHGWGDTSNVSTPIS